MITNTVKLIFNAFSLPGYCNF
uniref:Uncharacterized protein n=1 Tax=Anguilla anguilla TaxID=7936 RepID=A0A0E9SM56_ANGAN